MNKIGHSRVTRTLGGIVAVCWSFAQVATADFTYGEPTKIPNVSMPGAGSPQVSPDGLELYFAYTTEDDCRDLWVARRSTIKEPWGTPVRLDPPVNSPGPVGGVSISADGLELYFGEGHPVHWTAGCVPDPNGYGGGDLWVSRRATREDPWGTPQNLGPAVNTTAWDDHPSISADGLSLYFASDRAGGELADLFVSTRPTKSAPWGLAARLGAPIDSWGEATPFISPDGLSFFYALGGYTPDIYVSRRTSATAPWDKPVPFTPVNSPGAEYHLSFSSADPTFYFARGDGAFGPFDLWQVKVLPIVDFNADGKVDGTDLMIMAEHWGTDYPLCDIGPTPYGDGVVDVRDLMVLAEYMWGQIREPELIAWWKLDEAEGMVAHDSAGNHDASVVGNPMWRPTGGVVSGALELNGMTFAVADFVLNPSNGPFSVFAWVKGGAPGQVVVSQQAGVNWLTSDPSTGALMSELKSVGQLSKMLSSDAIVTDGNWHHIGFTWDGSTRSLHMDDTLVAEGADVGLVGCKGALCIGCGKVMTLDSLWTGLIDDVRIYSGAVRP